MKTSKPVLAMVCKVFLAVPLLFVSPQTAGAAAPCPVGEFAAVAAKAFGGDGLAVTAMAEGLNLSGKCGRELR